MKRTSVWKRVLFLPGWLLLLLLIVSAAGLAFVFLKQMTDSPAAYAVYAVSFYTVCVLTTYCCVTVPKRCRQLRQRIDAHPVGHRFLTDAAFQTHISLYVSLFINLLYVGLNLLSWFSYRSMWFFVLAGYYGILAVMRFLLVRYLHSHRPGENRHGELRRARLCACILLLLNLVLTGAVMMILYQNKGFSYRGMLIYAMAAYTFYITVHASIDLIRYRKYHSPVMTTAKIIALSAALVSMLALETAMLSQFGGDMAPEQRWLMIALTGAGVSIAVIGLSLGMIVRTEQERKDLEHHGYK